MNYTTQMDVARRGILTKELKKVTEKGRFDTAELMKLVAEGKVAIPANKCHQYLGTNGIGPMLKTKINVNLDIFRDCVDLNMGLGKVNGAVRMGAESIMDFSSFGDIRTFRKKLTRECPTIIGTVPTYDTVVCYHKPSEDITSWEQIDIIKMHAKGGVGFQTIHIGINGRMADRFKKAKCLVNIVSRGGSIVFVWMEMTKQGNPSHEHFDEILDICQEYDATSSLGDACRPGCIADASDIPWMEELATLGELTQKTRDENVQIVIEGPGHMPLNQIETNMKIQQTTCKGAPFYVLGPLVTNIVPRYDHITAAIEGAPAAASDASFLCYVTPTEHLRLPDVSGVEEGVIASRTAAHAADIVEEIKGAAQWDRGMSTTRKNPDWEWMSELPLDPEKAGSYRKSAKPEREDTCSMCGNFCAVRNMNRILNGEIVSISGGQ